MNDYCLFCDRDNKEKHTLILENELFYSRWDNIPASPGHAEIVPKKHIDSIFELTNEEVISMYDLLKKTKDVIDDKFHPDSYNLGENDGSVAGRSISHLHLHIIPRYKGDVSNPKGGVRNIIPGMGDYKEPQAAINME